MKPRRQKSDIGEINKFIVKDKNGIENKRYDDINNNININKSNHLNDNENENIGFRELLKKVNK